MAGGSTSGYRVRAGVQDCAVRSRIGTVFARQLRRDMTLAEARLWSAIRNNSLGYRIRRQHPLGPFIADFYCHEARLVIEVDGPIHETQVVRYAQRDAWIAEQGIEVLRFKNDQVIAEMPGVLDVLSEVIARRIGSQ